MSRQMDAGTVNHIFLPDAAKEHYHYHVGQRAWMFCVLLYKVALLCRKYQPAKPYTDYLSDTADIQVGTGVYIKGQPKIDAAHLCNTSFMSDRFLADVKPASAALTQYCRELRTASGATVPQTKSDNVGPDKVIDSFQTVFKNDYLRRLQNNPALVPDPIAMWQSYVTGLNTALLNSTSGSFTNPNSGGYAGAQMALIKMASLANGGIDWAVSDEFKHNAAEVAAL